MKIIENSYPVNDDYRMPGEFENHKGTYIIWPERTDNWRYGAKPAQLVFAEVANIIAKYEEVTVLVSEKQYNNARHLLDEKVRVIETSTNDSWIRDSGPTFITNGENIRAIDWNFNAWGGLEQGLYFPWDSDDILGLKVADIENVDVYKVRDFILEGGSIHVDGDGTILTTEECLLHGNRNNKLTKEEIENKLCSYLNCTKVLWLKEGIYNDETSGHIDNICTFIKPGEVALAWTDDKDDPQYKRSLDAYNYLSNVTDAKNRKILIHKIKLPTPILITKEESEGVDSVDGTLPRKTGDRLAASYINYYVGNNFVCIPIFNDKNDKEAIEKIKSLYPGRIIETVYAREILLGGGNIHCITQQIPE